MIKLEHTDVYGFESAIRGMRNPMNSWDKCDSDYEWNPCVNHGECKPHFVIGQNDLKLMKNLCKAGSDHRKFMRMLTVYVDLTAPLYWWKEFDTYKVGTVANSCSTMHKIHAKEFTMDDFSHEHLNVESTMMLKSIIRYLNMYRDSFIRTKEYHFPANYIKQEWWQMIQLLPTSYNQKRTVQLNYEVLRNMYHARKNHKLDEWKDFCKWIESLPYSELIVGDVIGE